MYLKSLSLRGFKSFADKTSMLFDPGLTVVVGPNGSGKSNISDAILWVLGEQSPKTLRGQAMEDVIFSGSSARQPVSMAEVTLVLDNSDGVLPVDHAEVAITRRVYRSGESEYLINNAPCRLLDIVDILHDSGLGREMHSIIGQGNLDSILSSRPEERRELIEEAAGISKHRRRKARSERRLKSMEDNLTRAKDISREIQRQLRPLERQVGKAQQARQLNARIHDLALSLAVDDLRILQGRHGEASAKSRENDAAVSVARLRLKQRTDELERYQSLLEEKGIFVGDLGAQRTRLQEQMARVGADRRLLGEKGRNMAARIQDLQASATAAEEERSQSAAQLERVREELAGARAEWEALKSQVDELVPKARAAKDRRRDLGRRLSQAQADQRAAQRTADQETLAYAKLRDQVSNAEVEDELFRNRLHQLDEQLASFEDRQRERGARKDELEAGLEVANTQAAEAQQAIRRIQDALQVARSEEREARDALSRQRGSLSALESVDEQLEASSPLVARLMGDADRSAKVRCRLADLIEVPTEYEGIVERLLGEDLYALVVADEGDAAALADAVPGLKGASGRAVVLRSDVAVPKAIHDAPGRVLYDELVVQKDYEQLLEALLGDVRIVEGTREALAAHDACPYCTYVTRDGHVALPDGRLVVGAGPKAEEGSLERKRRIRLLRDGMAPLERALEDASARVESRETELASTRDRNARAKGDAARIRGELTSVSAEVARLEKQAQQARSERQKVERQREEASGKAQDAREAIERHREAAKVAEARAQELTEAIESLGQQRNEASQEESDAERKVSDTRLRLAMVQERKNNLITREEELARSAERLARTAADARHDVGMLQARIARVAPLQEAYGHLDERMAYWQARLDDKASLAEADSESLKRTIGDARSAVDEARGELERLQACAADLRVELGKIEVQVKTAVGAIEALGEDVAAIGSVEPPADREASEAELEELRRKVKSLGPVNEVAMDEYLRLKERADYLAEQVEDLEGARKSLAKITAAIERKMRRQFLVVFEQVNQNFSEVFSLLFPGGQAHLEMTDPDHLTETGIEVIAQPRGKKIQKMMLMSGGEKSLTALALLFAVYRTRTVPFYVFDEVEAALDDANLGKLLDAMDELRKTTQLIVISHQRRTMESADVLYGVSMQADGVSHVVSQRLDHTGRMVSA